MARSPKRSRFGGRLRTWLVTAAVLATMLVAVPAASAGGGYTYWPTHASYTLSPTGWSNIRACPRCYVIEAVPNYTTVYMHCWVNDVWAYGAYWTNRWFYVTAAGRSWGGFIHASLVQRQAWTPYCG